MVYTRRRPCRMLPSSSLKSNARVTSVWGRTRSLRVSDIIARMLPTQITTKNPTTAHASSPPGSLIRRAPGRREHEVREIGGAYGWNDEK